MYITSISITCIHISLKNIWCIIIATNIFAIKSCKLDFFFVSGKDLKYYNLKGNSN